MSELSFDTDFKPNCGQGQSFKRAYDVDFQSLSDVSKIAPNSFKETCTVAVCDPVMKQEGFSKYMVYTIKGSDRQGAFEVRRRYSNFEKIRTLLVLKWPGCYIPPLPPKKLINMDPEFIEERRKRLEVFCKKIAEISYLYSSNEYQLFLRSQRKDLEAEMTKLEVVNYEEIWQRYKTIFDKVVEKDLNNETVTKIAEFRSILHRVLEYYANLKEGFARFVQTRKTFYEKMGLFHNAVCVEYENNLFREYHNDTESDNVFNNSRNQRLKEAANRLDDTGNLKSIDYFNRWVEYEASEVEAFLEAFAQRDKYEFQKNKTQEKQKNETTNFQDFIRGKSSWKYMLLGKSRQDVMIQLEKQIYNTTQEVEIIRQIHDSITLLLANQEIENFKATKMEKYYQIIKLTATNELTSLVTVYDYWDAVARSENVKDAEEKKS